VISLTIFLLLVGLIVFGPRKTIEMAQEIGRAIARLKEHTSDSWPRSGLDTGNAVGQRPDDPMILKVDP
jgi:Sec-independent protein translocase protein TatA